MRVRQDVTAWTEADAAELDCLLDELVSGYFDHRDQCARCIRWRGRETGATPCQHVRTAIDVVLEWRRRRELRTRAEELRYHREAAS